METYRIESIWRAMRLGQHAQAIDLLKQVLADDPQSALPHALLASNLIAQGRLHAGEHELKIALSLDPNTAWFYLSYARLCTLKNRPREAIQFCEQAQSLEPQNAEPLFMLSEIYLHLDDRPAAEACLKQAASLEPDSRRLEVALGEFYLSGGKFDLALQHAREALRADAGDADANLLMGKIQLALGNSDDAEYHAKFVISNNPSSKEALRLFSHVKMRRNPFLGLWWRLNSKIAALGNTKGAFVIIMAFLFFNLLARAILDLGYPTTSLVLSLGWVALVLYSWISIPMYHRALKKELEEFSFRKDY
ncbi:tetratricopeptide repeat protein [Allohahella sp. A8]|uniref:tetratricopeptide repeat protein n=1 Tax=Allohahella sp. A8 TaxID=3141461 RepID=UPI003A80DD96